MQTIRNFAGIAESSSLALFRGILSGSIINWRAEQFYACYDEYDQWVSEIGGDESGDNFLPHAIDFYSCQRKLQIDLITEIADYMAAHKIKDFPTERYLGFFGTSNMYGNLIEASQVLSVRNKIPVVFLEDDKLFEIEQSKWMIMRLAQAKLTNREKNRGLCDRLTLELATNFFHYEYNLFKTHRRIGFGFPKALDLTRIRYVKKIMKEVYVYPPSKGSDIPHH